MPKQEEFGFMGQPSHPLDNEPVRVTRRIKRLNSLPPTNLDLSAPGDRLQEKSGMKDFAAQIDFEGKRHKFSFRAHDSEEALARARWYLAQQYLDAPENKIDKILALGVQQIELSESENNPEK